MRFTRLSSIVLTILVQAAGANEHGAPAAAGEEGGGAKAGPSDHKEFVDKSTKLAALATKLEEAEKRFAEVVHEKEHATTADAKAPLLKELSEIAKQRNLDVTEYNKIKSELSLRYPNQGEHLNRHFEAREAQSAEQLEHRVTAGPTLDELLTDTKRLIDRKYAPFNPEPRVGPRTPAAVPARGGKHGEVSDPIPRLRLER